MIKISVIMPVYNSEQFLQETIKSVLNQNMEDFELILVDDGSSDSSGEICDGFKEKDNRVVVVHKENGGICSSRNCGLKIAKGEYIAFCDNDDLYLPGLLSDNYELAKRYDADLVRFCRKNVKTYNGKLISELSTGGFEFTVSDGKQLGSCYSAARNTGAGPWAGLYRRGFLSEHNICFDERMRYGYEDLMFNLRCYAVCNKIVLNPEVYYLWLQRIEHSTTGKYDSNVLSSLIYCASFEQELFRRKRVEEKNPGFWSFLVTNYYIADIYNRIRPETENLTNRERRKILSFFRNTPKIDYSLPVKGIALHIRKNPISLIARLLYQAHLYGMVYLLFNTYRDISGYMFRKKCNR